MFVYKGVLGSLILNVTSKVKNSKYGIQYGDQNWQIFTYLSETWYKGLFGVADFEFTSKITN